MVAQGGNNRDVTFGLKLVGDTGNKSVVDRTIQDVERLRDAIERVNKQSLSPFGGGAGAGGGAGGRPSAGGRQEATQSMREQSREVERLSVRYEGLGQKIRSSNEQIVNSSRQALEGTVSLGRGFVALGLAGEKDLEKAVRAFARFQGAADIIKGTTDIVMGGVRAYRAYRESILAAAAAQQVLGASQATRVGRSAAAGVSGGAAVGLGAAGATPFLAGAGPAAAGIAIAGTALAAVAVTFSYFDERFKAHTISLLDSLKRWAFGMDQAAEAQQQAIIDLRRGGQIQRNQLQLAFERRGEDLADRRAGFTIGTRLGDSPQAALQQARMASVRAMTGVQAIRAEASGLFAASDRRIAAASPDQYAGVFAEESEKQTQIQQRLNVAQERFLNSKERELDAQRAINRETLSSLDRQIAGQRSVLESVRQQHEQIIAANQSIAERFGQLSPMRQQAQLRAVNAVIGDARTASRRQLEQAIQFGGEAADIARSERGRRGDEVIGRDPFISAMLRNREREASVRVREEGGALDALQNIRGRAEQAGQELVKNMAAELGAVLDKLRDGLRKEFKNQMLELEQRQASKEEALRAQGG